MAINLATYRASLASANLEASESKATRDARKASKDRLAQAIEAAKILTGRAIQSLVTGDDTVIDRLADMLKSLGASEDTQMLFLETATSYTIQRSVKGGKLWVAAAYVADWTKVAGSLATSLLNGGVDLEILLATLTADGADNKPIGGARKVPASKK